MLQASDFNNLGLWSLNPKVSYRLYHTMNRTILECSTRTEIPNSLIFMIIKFKFLTNINKFSFVSMGWIRNQFCTLFTPKKSKFFVIFCS